jgi:DnaJ-class molecular chaperone
VQGAGTSSTEEDDLTSKISAAPAAAINETVVSNDKAGIRICTVCQGTGQQKYTYYFREMTKVCDACRGGGVHGVSQGTRESLPLDDENTKPIPSQASPTNQGCV